MLTTSSDTGRGEQHGAQPSGEPARRLFGHDCSCCRCGHLGGVDVGQRLLDRAIEVVPVERLVQPVLVDEIAQPGAEFDERHVHPLFVEFDVELFEDAGRGHVDVGDGLALEHDPAGPALVHEMAHLLAEHSRVGEEQRCLPPEHEHVGTLFRCRASRWWRASLYAVGQPARALRRAATSCA